VTVRTTTVAVLALMKAMGLHLLHTVSHAKSVSLKPAFMAAEVYKPVAEPVEAFDSAVEVSIPAFGD
jgi:hypothetical protein